MRHRDLSEASKIRYSCQYLNTVAGGVDGPKIDYLAIISLLFRRGEAFQVD